MESKFYLNTNFSDDTYRLIFFDDFIKSFFDEVDNYCNSTIRKHNKYHIAEYGEMTMVNFFISGIVRNDDIDRYILLNEFGLEKIRGNRTGRADIIMEDTLAHEIYYIEAKKITSVEDAPISDAWKEEDTKKYYQQVLEQAQKYLDTDVVNFKDDSRVTTFKIVLVFDSVRFKNKSKIKDWYFEGLKENEFYAFKTYPFENTEFDCVGLACYGKIEKEIA